MSALGGVYVYTYTSDDVAYSIRGLSKLVRKHKGDIGSVVVEVVPDRESGEWSATAVVL